MKKEKKCLTPLEGVAAYDVGMFTFFLNFSIKWISTKV